MFDWVLSWLSKDKLLRMAMTMLKRFAGTLYNDIARLVQEAERDSTFDSGYARGHWVVKKFVEAHNEWAEWEWVVGLLKDIAHAEINKKVKPPSIVKWVKGLF